MRIFAICVCLDEADILEQTLTQALAWADRIFVLDTGSTDGSWELTNRLSREHPAIVPYDRIEPEAFSDNIRSRVYHAFKRESHKGDWWCRLDADEMYIDDPRAFLASVPPTYQCVWSASFQYYFTDLDEKRYDEDPSRYAAQVRVDEKIHHYANNWSELRLIRDTGRLPWTVHSWPRILGRTWRQRIRLRHYAYRSPEQIDVRLRRRWATMQAGGQSWRHEWRDHWLDHVLGRRPRSEQAGTPLRTCPTWRDRVVPASALRSDETEADFVIQEDRLPPLPRRSGPSPIGFYMRAAARRLGRMLPSASNR